MNTYIQWGNIHGLRISVLNPNDILHSSCGEVRSSKSINYKTLQPEIAGLFCERIFGPRFDYKCACGTLTGRALDGRICTSCGVLVTSSRVRRYRMGHIALAYPIVHVWFLRVPPYYISSISGLRMRDIELLISSSDDVHTQISNASLRLNGHLLLFNFLTAIDLVQEYFYQKRLVSDLFYKLNHCNTSTATSITQINVQLLLRSTYTSIGYVDLYNQALKRFKLIESFILHSIRPEWLMLKLIPVLPPELRPFMLLGNNLFISSDLNVLYKKVIDRNNRLFTFTKLNAISINKHITHIATNKHSFVFNELLLLQNAVDSLLHNGRRGKAVLNSKRMPLKSLADILRGKDGRFRMNLLGKRVDVSGRTVIAVGPRLKLNQCGLPLQLIFILYKAFLYKKNIQPYSIRTEISTVSDLTNTLFINAQQCLHVVSSVIYNHPILLNRAPTLHRHNIQAFQPIAVSSKAIQLHPLVCSGFNADFDGDQMAVHLPLSLISQIEARVNMMPHCNIFNGSNGSIVMSPTQDVIFGIYYSSLLYLNANNNIPIIYNINSITQALQTNSLSIHTPIQLQINGTLEITTPGRWLLYKLTNCSIPYSLINKTLSKKDIALLIQSVSSLCSRVNLLYFLDQLMAFGFYYAHKAGISFCLHDVIVPPSKIQYITGTQHKVILASRAQKFQMSSIWNPLTMWTQTQTNITNHILNDVYHAIKMSVPPLYLLIHSGARGTITQMRQLAGMRGLMVKPSGDIIAMPILSNFKEGLSTLEYFHSTHGARKGVIDTSIKTATSGYLTRRLVHATHQMLISGLDCNSSYGITIRNIFKDGKPFITLEHLSRGRHLAKDLYLPSNGLRIYPRNTLLTADILKQIAAYDIHQFVVRSPLTCNLSNGICAYCYGTSQHTNMLPFLGDAIGITAAQSIGEPGTQLTMRTFHMGGVLQGSSSSSSNSIHTPISGRICLSNSYLIHISDNEHPITYKEDVMLYIISHTDTAISEFIVPKGSSIYINDGDFVSKGTRLYSWNSLYTPIIYDLPYVGTIHYSPITDVIKSYVITIVDNCLRPLVYAFELIPNAIHYNDYNLFVATNDIINTRISNVVHYGDLISYIPRITNTESDITGGLSLISQLFEVAAVASGANMHVCAHRTVISLYNSVAKTTPHGVSSNLVKLHANDLAYLCTCVSNDVPVSKVITLDTMDLSRISRDIRLCEAGETLVPQNNNFAAVLLTTSLGNILRRILYQLHTIYVSNGVLIHSQHIELVLAAMLSISTIVHSGMTPLIFNEDVLMRNYVQLNTTVLAHGGNCAKATVPLRGVTAMSLNNQSFLASASFQNTSRILTRAAIENDVDYLTGLHENVILGRMPPVGTGSLLVM